jgi:CheY-like chemotaxis protein
MSAAGPSESARDPDTGQSRGKVLVVEDVALIRFTTMDMAEQLGFETLEAPDAEEALALLDKHSEINILLTDLGLPGMSGEQLVEEALRLKPHLKVIIASGYSTRKDEDCALGRGISYLVKPFDMQGLREALES